MDPLSKVNQREEQTIILYTEEDLRKGLLEMKGVLEKRFYSTDVKSIYGIPRGGLILAVHLSHMFNVPLIFDPKRVNRHTIVVDDVVETGESIAPFKGHLQFAIHVNSDLPTNRRPAIYLEDKLPEEWIKFSWE